VPFVRLTGFEPATPWRVQGLFLVIAECLRKPRIPLCLQGTGRFAGFDCTRSRRVGHGRF
jgi:hypothetical protein